MSEQNTDEKAGYPPERKRRLGRRARVAVAVVTLVGAGAVLGAAATAQAARMGGWHGMGHGWSARSEEQVRERALDKAAWLLGRVDASQEQETRINAIVSTLVGELYREHRRRLIAELARPQVDREALEKIRTQGMALADSASRTIVGAVADTSETLTIEQREELAAMIGRRSHQ